MYYMIPIAIRVLKTYVLPVLEMLKVRTTLGTLCLLFVFVAKQLLSSIIVYITFPEVNSMLGLIFFCILFTSSDVSELSSARLSSDLARARGLSARLSSARAIFEPARV